MHDPTTLNRQGNDIGTQYRSIIFYNSTPQKEEIVETMEYIAEKKVWADKIVTEVVEYNENNSSKFWVAEDYHQNYFQKNPDQGYCQVVINPKINKFRKLYSQLLKS